MDTEFFCRKIRGLRFLYPREKAAGEKEKGRRKELTGIGMKSSRIVDILENR